jgi:hypothetical protein
MPRRNRRIGVRAREFATEEREPSYEDLARALVAAGKCSSQILDRPWTQGWGGTPRALMRENRGRGLDAIGQPINLNHPAGPLSQKGGHRAEDA